MADITIDEALNAFGLSTKESKIYLTCLELGTSTANEIANKAKLNRSTTYDLLKYLIEKGVGSKVIKEKTLHFEVVSPEKLISQLDEKKLKLNLVLKELKLLQKKVINKPIIKVFEGNSGVKNILNDILLTKKRTDVISTSKIFETFAYYFPHYINQRKELNISARVIQESSKQTTKLKSKDKEELRETRSLKNFNPGSVTFIYGDKVATIKLNKKELIGILIHDKTIADDKRQVFELLWEQAI